MFAAACCWTNIDYVSCSQNTLLYRIRQEILFLSRWVSSECHPTRRRKSRIAAKIRCQLDLKNEIDRNSRVYLTSWPITTTWFSYIMRYFKNISFMTPSVWTNIKKCLQKITTEGQIRDTVPQLVKLSTKAESVKQKRAQTQRWAKRKVTEPQQQFLHGNSNQHEATCRETYQTLAIRIPVKFYTEELYYSRNFIAARKFAVSPYGGKKT